MDDFAKSLASHLAIARQSKGLRIKQALFNIKAHYLFPLGISTLPGKLLADQLYPAPHEQGRWVMVAYGVALLIAPFMFRYARKNLVFDRERLFYLEALQQAIKEKGHPDAQ